MRGRPFTAACLVAAVAIAYGASLRNGFVFDDAMIVRDDPRVRTLGESQRLFVEPLWGYTDEDGVHHLHQYYRPLQTFPLAVARALFAERAWPAHLLSVALHAVNALLVWSILGVLLGTPAAALALAFLWALHPAYSEAVLWISNLAGEGAALAILVLFRMHLSPIAETLRGRILMSALLFVGLLFHEIGVIAPALMLAYEVTVMRPPRWRRLRSECAALAPTFAVYGALRVKALGGLLPGFGTQAMGPWDMVVNAVALLPQYVRTFAWPFDLNMYHDFNPAGGIAGAAFIGGAAVIVAAALLFALTLRRRPLLAFAVAWMAVTTAPYLIVRWPELNVFAERYLYLPSVGAFLLLGVAWQWGMEGRVERLSAVARPVVIAAVAIVACLGVVTIWRRIPDWHDNETLYVKTLTQSKRAWLIRNNLAVHYLEEKRYEEGIHVLHEALSASGVKQESAHNLGLLRTAVGDDHGALRAFQAAAGTGVPKLSTLLNLGYMYDRVGNRREAVMTYMKLLARAPEYVPAWFNLAMIAFEAGQYENSRLAVARVLSRSPDDAEAQALKQRLQGLAAAGQTSTAAPARPTRRDCRQAVILTRRRRFAEATAMLKAAAWLDEGAARPHQYLANVAALQGDLPMALAEEREALKREPGNRLYQRNVAALETRIAEAKRSGGSKSERP